MTHPLLKNAARCTPEQLLARADAARHRADRWMKWLRELQVEVEATARSMQGAADALTTHAHVLQKAIEEADQLTAEGDRATGRGQTPH